MKLYSYDFEVTKYDWLGIFKDYENKEFTVIHNDNEALMDFLDEEGVYVGFNSKHYDQFIVKGIAANASPEELKELNDYIIVDGQQGWDHPLVKGSFFYFNNVDIMDDMQVGLSLKAIEGHLGLSIEETEVDFNIDRPLTEQEIEQMIFYCKHDVDTTERLIDLRKGYLTSKMSVGRMIGLSDEKSLSMTNAKLTAALLQATPKTYTDEREYEYPPNLCREYIPAEVFDFFDAMYDKNIPDENLFKRKLKINVGGCPGVIGFGGIHAALPCYREKAEGTRVIRNYDVASLYPSLMIRCGYTSRSIPSAKAFEDVYYKRLAAKKSGDKATANALKLVLNTTYGAMLNRYNALYDPKMGRSVCISGQLFILELAERYIQDLKTVKILQLNTDGLMVSIDESELLTLLDFNEEWQKRTQFVLEEDKIDCVIQKDVNNYVLVKEDGNVKCKGGYLVRGIAPAGAFNINNNYTIVSDAIREYFVNGTPVENTISDCNDVMCFQIIAKAGSMYREAYHMVDGNRVNVQRVNRVYATTNPRYGKLYKVKAETDSTATIATLPEQCIVDNDNQITIDDIDKSFYVELAKKRINDFLGIKPEKERKKTMSTTTKANIYARLATVREKFLEHGIQKTGKNIQLKSMYFQLDDIVPVSTPLFHEQGLIPLTNFTKEECTLTVVDMNDKDSFVMFTAPMREWAGNAAVTPVQALGATITYMRRYLYQIALDIVEIDEMESGITPTSVESKVKKSTTVAESKPSAPVSEETREKTKLNLTNPDGAATPLQIDQLKKVLKQLREKDTTKEDMISDIALQTHGFTTITKDDCEKLITSIVRMIGGEN